MADLLCSREKCTGCAACYNACPKNAIIMKTDSSGFTFPYIESKSCIECHKCTAICPVLKTEQKAVILPTVYAAYSKNKNEILHSSSGGIFFELAKWVIGEHGVVFSAYMTKNRTVEFSYGETLESIKKFRGSKYVESLPGNIYRKMENFLKENRLVLFCGLPCQVAGALSYLKQDYDNLYTLDLVCHGVPSGKLFQDYMHNLEKKQPIKNIYFRYKNHKWTPLLRSNCKIEFRNGSSAIYDYKEDTYLTGFNKNIILRKSCYSCRYAKIPRISDITLGDFMGLGIILPYSQKAERGISQVLINSQKGMKLYKSISPYIESCKRDLKESLYFNHNLWKPSKSSRFSQSFYEDYKQYGYIYVEKKYLSNSQFQKIKNAGKEALRFLLGDKFVVRLVYLSYKKNGLIQKADSVYDELKQKATTYIQD